MQHGSVRGGVRDLGENKVGGGGALPLSGPCLNASFTVIKTLRLNDNVSRFYCDTVMYW